MRYRFQYKCPRGSRCERFFLLTGVFSVAEVGGQSDHKERGVGENESSDGVYRGGEDYADC